MSKHMRKRYVARYLVRACWSTGIYNTFNILHESYALAQAWGIAYCSRHDKCTGFEIVKRFVEETEDEM